MVDYNPYVHGLGDDTTREVADLVEKLIYGAIPCIRVDLGVNSRIESKDGVLNDFIKAQKKYGSAIKISTASNDPLILEAKENGILEKQSANILIRPEAGVIAMLRMIKNSKIYGNKTIAVFRYGSGDFYEEKSFSEELINGVNTGIYTTHINLTNLKPFAELAVQIAQQHGLELFASSKWTIAESESRFIGGITSVWDNLGVKYERVLTDVAIATIAIDRKGGWLGAFGNASGDTASDTADFVDGSRTMSSELFCGDGSSYVELPGGTAPDKLGTDLKGINFLNPSQIIYGFDSAIEKVNPSLSESLAEVRQAAQDYIESTPVAERDTFDMIAEVGKVATRLGLN